MNNFENMKTMIDDYILKNGIEQNIVSCLHDTSKNDSEKGKPIVYLYENKNDLQVIDMDTIAKYCYKMIKNPENPGENPVNSADAFLINSDNDWYFIEFKDKPIQAAKSGLKDNIIKKAYSNWYMLMDILYEMQNTKSKYPDFEFDNPIKFAQEHVYYILVCTINKNPEVYKQIKNMELINSTYTPPFMCRLKGYLFKDTYVYTEDFLERKFVNNFVY